MSYVFDIEKMQADMNGGVAAGDLHVPTDANCNGINSNWPSMKHKPDFNVMERRYECCSKGQGCGVPSEGIPKCKYYLDGGYCNTGAM